MFGGKLSDELADIVGKSQATKPQVRKAIYAYIDEKNLKDPEDGRFFTPDAKMAKVFGKDKMYKIAVMKCIKDHYNLN